MLYYFISFLASWWKIMQLRKKPHMKTLRVCFYKATVKPEKMGASPWQEYSKKWSVYAWFDSKLMAFLEH